MGWSKDYIQCVCIYSSAEDKSIHPKTDFAVVQKIRSKTFFIIDAWRHALDESENRIGDLYKGQRCQIQEWFLKLSRKEAEKILATSIIFHDVLVRG